MDGWSDACPCIVKDRPWMEVQLSDGKLTAVRMTPDELVSIRLEGLDVLGTSFNGSCGKVPQWRAALLPGSGVVNS